MKTLFIVIFLIISSYNSFGQLLKPEKSTIACNKNFILYIAKEMPKLEIGIDTLQDFLNQKIKLTIDQMNEEGRMVLGFIINCKGEAGDYHIVQTNIPSLFDPLVKTLKDYCKWIPGKQGNMDIDMYYSFNITLSKGKLKINVQNYRY